MLCPAGTENKAGITWIYSWVEELRDPKEKAHRADRPRMAISSKRRGSPFPGLYKHKPHPLPVALGSRLSQSLGRPSPAKSPWVKLDVLAMSSLPDNFPPKIPCELRCLSNKNNNNNKKGNLSESLFEKDDTRKFVRNGRGQRRGDLLSVTPIHPIKE